MPTTASRLAVLLFTDIVGSTDLKIRLGTGAYVPLLERHNALFEQACAGAAAAGAQILKHTGDGFLAVFATASDAVRAALRFQQAMRSEPWPSGPLTARVGIHVGEVDRVRVQRRPPIRRRAPAGGRADNITAAAALGRARPVPVQGH